MTDERSVGPLEQHAIDTDPFGGMAGHYYRLYLRNADRIKELESALASERAKRVEAEALAERWKSVDAVTATELLAVEATIEQVRVVAVEMSDDPEYPLERLWRSRIMDALANADTSALARHNAEVAARALEEAADSIMHREHPEAIRQRLRARAAEK